MSTDGPATARKGLVTVAVMTATVMQVIDTTIVNVSLPHMQGSLSATVDQISWVVTSYLVAAAVMTPPTGWLSRRFGRKRLFLAAVAAFTVASVLCGIAQSLTAIVVYRLLQGMSGAALVPLSQAALLDAYPRSEHGTAMALFGIGLMVGPIAGPSLGGYLTETYNWRWVFFINLPVGILAFLLIGAFVDDTPRDRERPFDWFGFAMLSLGVGALQLMLDRGQGEDWFASGEIVAETLLAAFGLYLFLTHSLTTARPFLDFRLFRDRNFTAGSLFIFVVAGILFATLVLIPPFMQNLLGYPVLATGLILAPRGMATMAAMFLVGRLSGRLDVRWMILNGLALNALALWLMTGFNLDVTTGMLLWSGVVQGFAFGFLFVPITTATFSTLPAADRAEGAAVFSLLRNIGGAIGISTVVTLLSRGLQANHAHLSVHIAPHNDALHAFPLPGGLSPDSPAGLALLDGLVNQQAALIAYLNDFRFMMWVSLAAMPLVLILRRRSAAVARAPAAE